MFKLFTPPPDSHLIDRGWVLCPTRGHDVEVDVCAGCRWRLELDEDAELPFVRCQPQCVPAGLRQMRI